MLRLLGLKLMRPEYRALLRGPYGASYMGLRPIPPHPVGAWGEARDRNNQLTKANAWTRKNFVAN